MNMPMPIKQADSVKYVDQLLRSIPEHWVAWLTNRTNKYTLSISDVAKSGDAENPALKSFVDSVNKENFERATNFLKLVIEWNAKTAHEREEAVRLYSRAWTMHLMTRGVQKEAFLVPREIRYLTPLDYARLARFVDSLQECINLATNIRAELDWDTLPDSLVKVLLENTFRYECRSIYAPFFDAFMNDTLKEEV